jgi:hypothetical protein
MTIRRLVVFSGFHTKFVAPAKISLKARQTEVVFTSTDGQVGLYLETLLGLTLKSINEMLSKNDARIVGVVASSIEEEKALELERKAFFPAFRRMAFPSAYSKDIHRVNEVVNKLVSNLSSDGFLDTYRYVKPPSGVLSLPLLNVDSPRLKKAMIELYEMRILRPGGGIDKEVVRLRGGRGLRIKGIDFAGCMNDPAHPIRRVTDSTVCDVGARLRLGFSIPSRFEFDVSCEQGVSGKSFRLCDGSAQQIPGWADHLNMRINDDFKSGSKS